MPWVELRFDALVVGAGTSASFAQKHLPNGTLLSVQPFLSGATPAPQTVTCAFHVFQHDGTTVVATVYNRSLKATNGASLVGLPVYEGLIAGGTVVNNGVSSVTVSAIFIVIPEEGPWGLGQVQDDLGVTFQPLRPSQGTGRQHWQLFFAGAVPGTKLLTVPSGKRCWMTGLVGTTTSIAGLSVLGVNDTNNITQVGWFGPSPSISHVYLEPLDMGLGPGNVSFIVAAAAQFDITAEGYFE